MILPVYPTKYVTVSGCIIRSKLHVHARHRFATSTHQTAAPFEDLPLDGIAGRLFFSRVAIFRAHGLMFLLEGRTTDITR